MLILPSACSVTEQQESHQLTCVHTHIQIHWLFFSSLWQASVAGLLVFVSRSMAALFIFHYYYYITKNGFLYILLFIIFCQLQCFVCISETSDHCHHAFFQAKLPSAACKTQPVWERLHTCVSVRFTDLAIWLALCRTKCSLSVCVNMCVLMIAV